MRSEGVRVVLSLCLTVRAGRGLGRAGGATRAGIDSDRLSMPDADAQSAHHHSHSGLCVNHQYRKPL